MYIRSGVWNNEKSKQKLPTSFFMCKIFVRISCQRYYIVYAVQSKSKVKQAYNGFRQASFCVEKKPLRN